MRRKEASLWLPCDSHDMQTSTSIIQPLRPGTTLACQALNGLCAVGLCEADGCTVTLATGACDDEDPCNGLEVCSDGTCVPTDIPLCGDGVTDSSCGETCEPCIRPLMVP